MKPIIIYYSRSGNTEAVADKAKADLECESIKIIPEEAYGNYVASCLRVMKERGKKVIPAFVTEIPDLSGFDVVLLGYPVWAQDMPAFVAEFVSRCNLEGKTVIPFVTYGMSGYNWTQKTVDRVCRSAKVELPFQSGVFKKGNYDEWIASVKKLIQ